MQFLCFYAYTWLGGAPGAPTDLVTSEVTHHSFRATWTAPDGPVEKYRVEYVALSGGPQQVYLPHTIMHYNSTAANSITQIPIPVRVLRLLLV